MRTIRENYHHPKGGKVCVQTRDYPTGERTVRTVDRRTGGTNSISRTHWTGKK
ncbi:hypothetical protein [Brevundimonas sp.]|uniref:hypothetical protein n=1 Tax=Brevundimonas sp. TaxID=1871086 RepID=UPI0035179CCC